MRNRTTFPLAAQVAFGAGPCPLWQQGKCNRSDCGFAHSAVRPPLPSAWNTPLRIPPAQPLPTGLARHPTLPVVPMPSPPHAMDAEPIFMRPTNARVHAVKPSNTPTTGPMRPLRTPSGAPIPLGSTGRGWCHGCKMLDDLFRQNERMLCFRCCLAALQS